MRRLSGWRTRKQRNERGLPALRNIIQGSEQKNSNDGRNKQATVKSIPVQKNVHPTEGEHRTREQAHWGWQVKSEERRDRITKVTLAISFVALVAAGGSYWQSSLQAGSAISQTKILSAELELSERPWISIAEGSFVTPMTFDASGAHFVFSIKINNVGHSPALNVWNYVEAFAYRPTISPVLEQQRVCKEKKRTAYDPEFRGFTVFPDRFIEPPMNINVSSESIAKSIQWDLTQDAKPRIAIYIVGCFDYGFSFIEKMVAGFHDLPADNDGMRIGKSGERPDLQMWLVSDGEQRLCRGDHLRAGRLQQGFDEL